MAGEEAMSADEKGTLRVLGVGPGDAELLTLKAARIIASGAIIAYPVGGDSGTSLARRIVADLIPVGAQEIAFSVPMRLEREPAARAYDAAAVMIASALDQGQDVALLCEGDPFFYGSAMYLVERLNGRYACEIVPGITSLTACAAAICRPLAARNERLKVLPAPMDEAILKAELADTEAAAIIKVGRHFEKIRRVLRHLMLDEQAFIIESATGADQKITPLNDVAEGERPYFSTILIYRGAESWGQSG